MSQNTKRNTNRLHLASLLRAVIVTTFLGAAGLSYVYLKNQLHVSGVQRKALEQELNDLIAENNVMEAQISRLTSHTALQRRLDEGFIKLVPISSQAIVRVRSQDGARWAGGAHQMSDQIQTVSHEGYVRR